MIKQEKTIMDGLKERIQSIEKEIDECHDDKDLFSLSMEKANLEYMRQKIKLQEEREYLDGLEKLVVDARRGICNCLGEYVRAEKNLRELEEKYRINRLEEKYRINRGEK